MACTEAYQATHPTTQEDRNVSEKPPLGMTKTPDGWPEMADAFLGFAHYAIGEPGFIDQYQTDTGKNLYSAIPNAPINQMIDEATGYGRQAMADFMDWLTINHWGEA